MLQANVVLDCGATETAGGVESSGRFWWMLRREVFLILALEWELPAQTIRALSRVLVADSFRMDQHFTLWKQTMCPFLPV